MIYTPRLTKPNDGNPYYNTKSNGGYSNAIVGSPTDKGCNVLSNCVGYAFGRFNEITNNKSMSYLKPVNAEKFMGYKGTLKSGATPKLGACMVWQKGTSSASDGAGHVAIVEKIISETEVVTSESAYGKTAFYTMTRKKGSGLWGEKSPYSFLGFIYQPTDFENGYKTECEYDSSKSGVYTTTAPLNLRVLPSTAQKSMIVIPKGAIVDCDGVYKGEWYLVTYKSLVGFCSSRYLK